MSLRNHKISVKGYNGYFLKISIVWVLASYLTMCVSNLAAVAFMILSCLTLSFLNIRFYCDHNDQSHLASKDTITAWCKVRILEESTSENLQIETENISVAIILCLNVGDLFCFSERVDSFNIHNSELKSWCWSSYDYKLHYHFSLLVCSVVCLRCCNKLATQLGMNYEVIRLKYYSASLMLIFSFSDAFTFFLLRYLSKLPLILLRRCLELWSSVEALTSKQLHKAVCISSPIQVYKSAVAWDILGAEDVDLTAFLASCSSTLFSHPISKSEPAALPTVKYLLPCSAKFGFIVVYTCAHSFS